MSKRVAWKTMQRLYVGRRYVGRKAGSKKQMTFKVVDVTMGGDVIISRRGYGDSKMSQDVFMEFVSRARDITER